MGEWRTVFEEEVEGRLVTVKIYQSEDTADDDGDEGAVRVVVMIPATRMAIRSCSSARMPVV